MRVSTRRISSMPLLVVVAWASVGLFAATPASAACAVYPGTAGGTIAVGQVAVRVPPTPAALVGICVDAEQSGFPSVNDPIVVQGEGCGVPCVSVCWDLPTTGTVVVSVTVIVQGNAETTKIPVGGEESERVQAHFGDPPPGCGS